MLRLAELGLFLLPFALYGAWVFASARARPALFWGVAALLLPLVACLFWFGAGHGIDANRQRYVPAHVEAGRIIPGHAEAVNPVGPRVAPERNAPWRGTATAVAPSAVAP
jgi:hypothetical protein